MSDKQRLVLSIIDFLNQSIQDGTVKQDDQESLEVAIQCIGEAFGVDPSDEGQTSKLSVKPATLQSIFDVFIKTRSKMAAAPSTSEAQAPASNAKKTPSPADIAAAEKFKSEGNAKMSAKEYDAAIDLYTRAIALDPKAVYYSNRAAAYSSKGDHQSAVSDAEDALITDSKFIKAYHRLGHAHYCLGDYSSAADSFRRGLEMDPTNASLKTGLQSAEARIAEDDEMPPLEPADLPAARSEPSAGATPDLGGMADMLRNMGMGGGGGAGGAGAGGMPDLAGLMSNPMMMQMAQQMMQNGGMERLMQNPNVANMMNRMQSGGGMPSMAELMTDPALRDLASQFGAGAGAGR